MRGTAENGEGPPADESVVAGRGAGRDPYILALLALILAMAALYTFYFYQERLPFRESGADTYGHLGMLRTVEDRIGLGDDLDADLFPGLYSGNERSGINYVAMALIASVPGASDFTALYVFGLLGISLFLSGIYFLTRALSGSSRAAFLAAMFSLVLCSAEVVVRGNSFSFVELLACAHYASVVAMGLMMLALARNIRYLKEGDWKSYLLQLLLAVLVLNIHLLTGIGYLLVLVLLVVVYAAWEKRLTRRHLLLLSLIPAALALLSLWPLYHWWDIFGGSIQGANSALGEPVERYSSFGYFFQATVFFFIGLPFLLRKERERVFLLAWALAFTVIALSFLLPVSIAFYWRFAYVMRIPLVIGLALGLGVDIWRLQRWRAVAIPVILAVVGVFFVASLVVTARRYQDIMGKDGYAPVEAFMETGGEGRNLLAHPVQGYMLMGISGYNIYSITQGHASPEIITARNERLEQAYASPAPDGWGELLGEFRITDTLVARDKSSLDAALLLNGVLEERNAAFDLYAVDPEGLDTAVLASTPDPKLEDSEVVNGFTRFGGWAWFQWEGREPMEVESVHVDDGDDITSTRLRVTARDDAGALVFINRGYIEVDPARRYRIAMNTRVAEGEPQVYLVFYQYAAPSPQALISRVEMKIHRDTGEWTRRNFIVWHGGEEKTDIVLSEHTRYVKIGVLPCYRSAGQVEVGRLDISEKP
ncbi:MAG: hypothetical protein AB1384_04855 [Actinomycetota bacterium]